MQKALDNMPDIAPEGPLKGKGLLSPIGDPLGHVLKNALKPVGHVVGAVGNTNGQAFLDAQEYAKQQMGGGEDDEEPKQEKRGGEKPGGERIGGGAKTGQNPLGL